MESGTNFFAKKGKKHEKIELRQAPIFISVCNFHISLQLSRHDSSTSYVRGFTWIPCHYELELINHVSHGSLWKRQRKTRAKKIDYYLLLKSS
jgi:hypothetical protein